MLPLGYAAVACRAVIFDFNGTLSADEPILYAIYAGLFAEHGRPLSEADYYDQLAGLSDPEIVHRWLGRRDDAEHVVSQRVTRYREAVADGATIGPAVRRAVAFAAARVPVAIVSGAAEAEIAPVIASRIPRATRSRSRCSGATPRACAPAR